MDTKILVNQNIPKRDDVSPGYVLVLPSEFSTQTGHGFPSYRQTVGNRETDRLFRQKF